jgi:hypothetical protein
MTLILRKTTAQARGSYQLGANGCVLELSPSRDSVGLSHQPAWVNTALCLRVRNPTYSSGISSA